MKKLLLLPLLLTLIFAVFSSSVLAETHRLTGKNVLVLYKHVDGLSKKIAFYYANKRHVPKSQVVAVDIMGDSSSINRQKFASIQQQIAKHLTPNIKVLLLTWNAPYRVDCMSITSAFTLGFNEKFCSHTSKMKWGCRMTAVSPFYNASSDKLWQSKNLRLSIMLSGRTFEEAKQLIDRGVASDNTHPGGDAYLVRTQDRARSTRWPIFKRIAELWPKQKGIRIHYVDDSHRQKGTSVKYKNRIMFYETGYVKVPAIKTNHYLPGAIADHLTSLGGTGISTKGQMKAYRWLEAGATGSYGTVVEPCAFPEKFPNPQILIPSYIDGDTLIEAYWKSVQQPGEGIFIGEPLACPWCSK